MLRCDSKTKPVTAGARLCAALICALMLTGCAKAPTEIEITPQAIDTTSSVVTLTPDVVQTPVVTPTPSNLPTQIPTQTQTQTPTTTADDSEQLDRVTVYDGFYYERLSAAIKKRITGMSYPEGDCEISYDELRYITVRYTDFSGAEHEGELIANKSVARELCEIFKALYDSDYHIAKMRLVDDYGEPGDDNLSMADNNTSAFNYRRVSGSTKLSRHSYGLAVDINPLMNPYIDGDRVAPPAAAAYADRTEKLPGMIDHDDLCYKLFIKYGWVWGGDWSEPDYQHFSKPS